MMIIVNNDSMLLLMFVVLFFSSLLHSPADAFDPLDPEGNITIRWDIQEWRDDQEGYGALVTIFNYQLYRHIEKPGWKLSWGWQNGEVIWDARGAEATTQGNCSRVKGGALPHCCEQRPVMIDLLPGSPYNIQTANCCRGGVLSSLGQNPLKSVSSFQLSVGKAFGDYGNATFQMPANFSIGVPGYTCSDAVQTNSTKFPADGGRRTTEAMATFKVSCSYSEINARPAPSCCVSLSTFYNDTIVPCPRCSCGCMSAPNPTKCVRQGEQPPILQMPHDENDIAQPIVQCTQHMCPIRVHWHVKVNYREYWRVKMTVTNFNFVKNYSEWNLVVQHPNLENLTQVFSFNYEPLNLYPGFNDSGMFWGIQSYNDMLLQSGDSGNVQTEMLLRKEPGEFTFRAGWAFPRKIYFNGEQCVMPPPDLYPQLPNGTSRAAPLCFGSLRLLALVLLFMLMID